MGTQQSWHCACPAARPWGLTFLDQALAIRRELGDRRGAAQTAISLAETHFMLSGPGEALEPHQAALAAAREADNPSLLTVALNNLGEVYLELGLLDEAADCFRQTRDISASLSVHTQAYALHNLGRVYVELGRPQEAIASLTEALAIFENLNEDTQAAEIRSALASGSRRPRARQSYRVSARRSYRQRRR